jgi:hypothetical protein
VHFLDDDDIAPERHYAAVKAAFETRPGGGVASSPRWAQCG